MICLFNFPCPLLLLIYLLLNSCDSNDAIVMSSWNSPAPSARNTRFYLSRCVAVNLNPVDYQIRGWWRNVCANTGLQHQRLKVPHWHMGKHITKMSSCKLLVNGESGYMQMWRQKVIILDIC